MARRPETAAQLEALSRRLQQTRLDLGSAAVATRRSLDLPARFHTAIRRHPARWFAGSLAAGLLASLALRHRRSAAARHAALHPPARQPPRRLALAGAAGFLGSLLRPILADWLARHFHHHR